MLGKGDPNASLHYLLLPAPVSPVATLLSCWSDCSRTGILHWVSWGSGKEPSCLLCPSFPKLAWKTGCLVWQRSFPCLWDVKHVPRHRRAARALNWLFTQKKVVFLTRTVHPTTCYAVISGASLFSLCQVFHCFHAWNSLCSGICPDQALQFCFHWSMNSHWPVESQFRCNTFTVIYMPDCCLLGAVDGRGQCGRRGSIREPFCGTQHGSLLGCTFWSQLLTFGPFQERGRERQETVYPCGSLIWMHDVQSILKLFWQSNCVCKALVSLGLV